MKLSFRLPVSAFTCVSNFCTAFAGRSSAAALTLCLVVAAQAVMAPAAKAVTLTVSSTADVATNFGACGSASTSPTGASLREAVCAANNAGATSSTINIVTAGTYTLTNGELAMGKVSGSNITLNGTGAGSTIISGNNASRVFDLDISVVGGVTTSISGVTITNGAVTTFGGAGIIAGSGHATTKDTLTLSNSTVSNNVVNSATTNKPGGGLEFQGGSLTITNSTFSGNTSGSSSGSAIAYDHYDNAAGEQLTISGTTFSGNSTNASVANINVGGALHMDGVSGTVPMTVTNSRFIGNTVVGSGTGIPQGGAIFADGGGTLTVTESTFTGNSVAGGANTSGGVSSGGAIAVLGFTAVLHYNRFTGNVGPNGSAVAMPYPNNGSSVDATNNWWGCNTGPGTAGCDTVFGGPTVSPRLVLTATASPATVVGPNATPTITAALTQNSLGSAIATSNLDAFTGLPVVFSDPQPGGATLTAASANISSGSASTGYNSQNSSGAGHVVATLDNGASTAPITVNRAPAITSANSVTFIAGTAGTFTVTTTGYPAPAIGRTGTLPPGMTFTDLGNGTATLSGTPTAGGIYPLSLTANNGVSPNATQTLTVTVNQAPAITSANATALTVGSAGTFTVTTTGYPVPTVTQTGTLPSGVTFDSAMNKLAGTPGAGTGGTYSISFKASNGIGSDATQTFTLTVNQAPAITSANAATFTVGSAGTFTLTTTGFPVPTVTQTGTLPSGVTFNSATNKLAGTPGAGTGGTYSISFKASNGVGSDATQTFTLTVNQAPAITSANATTFVVGTAGTFTVTTTGFPNPGVTETGTLPSGVSFDSATKTLSGTPGAGTGGTYPFSFKAANGIGSDAVQTFTLTVNQAPAITSANNTTFTVGTAGTFTVTATGFPSPTFSETGALPAGITLGAVSGVLSGTPGPDTQGVYNITMMASNGVGSAAAQPFTLTINAIPCTAAASGLITWLPANNNANDLIGSNNAVLQGGATYGTGEVGQAFNLVNAPNATSGQYVNVATPVGLPVGNAARTVQMWFNSATNLTTSPNAALFQYGTAALDKSFGLVFTASNPGKLMFNGSGDDVVGTATVTSGVWHHVAVTYDGATLKLYLDGQLDKSQAANGLFNTTLDANGLTIGSRPGVSVFNGKIDEVQIFDRALSQAEVQATYYAGAQGTCAPPLNLTSAASRRVHGATAFDVALPLTGTVGIEPRTSTPAGSHTVVFTFSHSVTSGSASVTTGTGTAGAATFSGATMSVPLSNVTNAQQITLTLSGVTDALSQVLPTTTVKMAVLAGDLNGDRVVNAADATIARNRSGLPIDATTFAADVNVDGSINAADATIVRNSSGSGLSPAASPPSQKVSEVSTAADALPSPEQ